MKKLPSSLSKIIIPLLFLTLLNACGKKEGLCELPGADGALKAALVQKMTSWQSNAKYAGFTNFEAEVNQVIADLVVVDNSYQRGTDESCYCKARFQFKDHADFFKVINEPVSDLRAQENPIDRDFLKLEEKINYIDHDGFEFFYILQKTDNKQLLALQNYPLPLQPQVDDAGKMLWDYMEYRAQKP